VNPVKWYNHTGLFKKKHKRSKIYFTSTVEHMAGHVARMGEVRGVYNILVGRSEERRPLGRPRRRWEDNIKMDLGR
jgi:hypothetical protein